MSAVLNETDAGRASWDTSLVGEALLVTGTPQEGLMRGGLPSWEKGQAEEAGAGLCSPRTTPLLCQSWCSEER